MDNPENYGTNEENVDICEDDKTSCNVFDTVHVDNRYKCSQSDLYLAATQGRLWMVKRCYYSGVDVDLEENKALQLAVMNGRTAVVEFLLEVGSNKNIDNILALACTRCCPRIVELLVVKNADIHYNDDQCLFTAIETECTSIVYILLKHDANVAACDNKAIILACQMQLVSILKLLISYGADVNARNGMPLIEASINGYVDIVELLIKSGADVNIRNDMPLLEATRNNHIRIMILLLNYGADKDVLKTLQVDEVTMCIVDAYSKKLRVPRLAKAIHGSFKKQDFKWQEYCAKCGTNDDIELLCNQAKLFSLNINGKSKRKICAELAIKLEECMNHDKYDENFCDFSGTSINDLPFWKIMVVDNIPFNVFDLFKLVSNGEKLNPYTKTLLPLQEIKDKEQFLRNVLTKEKFKNMNLLQQVADYPILSDYAILRNKLEKEVWDILQYPPSITVVMDADDGTIDAMVRSFKILSSSTVLGIRFSYIQIYSMVSDDILRDILNSCGFEKKKKFVDFLSLMLNKNDEYRDTRCIAVSILLRHFASPDEEDDDLTFITGDLEDLYDEDDDLQDLFDIFNFLE